MTIGAGITTYNDIHMTIRCVESIINNSNSLLSQILVLDDGSSRRDHIPALGQWLKSRGVTLLVHNRNLGIPASWNDLSDATETDVVTLWNNDIVITSPHTFTCLKYFLENNEHIGSVGWNLIQVDPTTGVKGVDPSMQYDPMQCPGKVGAPVGCSFGFRRSAWEEVNGFNSELVSFHEETWFSFKLCEKGYVSYMLPFPSVEHWGSQTFAKNPELAVCRFNDAVADKKEYRETLANQKHWEKLPHLKWQNENDRIIWNDPAYGDDCVYRMDYSRYLFAKHYGVLDNYAEPQVEVHRRIVDPLPEPFPIKWLNREMRPCVRDEKEAWYE